MALLRSSFQHEPHLGMVAMVLGLVGILLGPLLIPALLALFFSVTTLVHSRDVSTRLEAILAILLAMAGFLLGLFQLLWIWTHR